MATNAVIREIKTPMTKKINSPQSGFLSLLNMYQPENPHTPIL